MLKITKSKKKALSESAINYLKNKTAKKIEESKNLKEDIDISRWSGGKWNEGRYIVDKNQLIKALKYAAQDFIDDPESGGCFTFPIDDNIGVVVGWSDGYDRDDADGFIANNGWHVVAGLKCYRSDDMGTDYDYINFPFFSDGEVLEWEAELPANLDSRAYGEIADYLIRGYDELSKYDFAKNGEIIDFTADEDDLDDAFIDDVEELDEDVRKEWKPDTSFKHIKKVLDDAIARGKYVNNEREEVFAAMDKADKGGYTPEQRKFIRDKHADMWRKNRNANECVKEGNGEGKDKFEGTPKEYVHADRDLFLKKLQQRGHRKPIVKSEEIPLTNVKESKGKGMIDVLGKIKAESCGKKKSRKKLKESEELDRKLFTSLVKLGDKPYDGYSILNDGYFVKRIYAESDDDAVKQFRAWVDKGGMKNESCNSKKLKEALNFVKLNDEPIEIEYVEDEHDESRDFQPSFWWWNRRYYLDDFIRIHNNPWVSSVYDEYPEYIHAYESDNYHNPLYIEITDDGDYVNVYEEKESTNESCKRESIGEDVSEYQKWVDYDMKKYHKISKDTMDKIKSAGLSVVKDQYGDYEVIADRPIKEYREKKCNEDLSYGELAAIEDEWNKWVDEHDGDTSASSAWAFIESECDMYTPDECDDIFGYIGSLVESKGKCKKK